MRRRASLAVLLAAASLAPTVASAHLMNTGFGPFYDGLAHPLVTIDDLLPVIGMALLGGLGGARSGRVVLFALPTAWLAGMIVGRSLAPPSAAPGLTAATTIALGLLVAADRRPPLSVVAACAMVLGLVHGALNGAALPAAGSPAPSVLGVACTIFVLAALVSGTVVSLRAPWMRIVVRVAGSWIAAIGLLMLGWSMRTLGLHG